MFMKNLMLKVLMLSVILSILIIPSILVNAVSTKNTAEEIYFEQDSTYQLDSDGDETWFKIYVNAPTSSGYDQLSDIYIKIDTIYNGEGMSATLYSDDNYFLSGDSTYFTHEFYLKCRKVTKGWYYIKIDTKGKNIDKVKITAEQFITSYDNVNVQEEPNNWFRFATPLLLDSSISIRRHLGYELKDDYRNSGVDIYEYTASEPCMLKVNFDPEKAGELDIYVGDSLIASTVPRNGIDRIQTGKPYYFNHTHGSCYFKIHSGYEYYKFEIFKEDYQAEPVFYIKNPQSRQIFGEFDTLTPEISVLGNGRTEVYYSYIKNGQPYPSEKENVIANTTNFSDYRFQTISLSAFPGGSIKRNAIQFTAGNTTATKSSQSASLNLRYDDAPPLYKDIEIETNEDSIEINLIEATDEVGLAQRPYRYRIYPKGSQVPTYSEWMTSNYYSKGIDIEGEIIRNTEYIIDVQVRDMVAEKYQYDKSEGELVNHILTVSETVYIN